MHKICVGRQAPEHNTAVMHYYYYILYKQSTRCLSYTKLSLRNEIPPNPAYYYKLSKTMTSVYFAFELLYVFQCINQFQAYEKLHKTSADKKFWYTDKKENNFPRI